MGLDNITPDDNILWPNGSDNMGSILETGYFASVDDFQTLNTPSDNPSTFAQAVEISSEHVFKAGKGWKKFYITEDTGGVQDEMVGEKDGKSFRNKLMAFHPGTKKEALGFFAWLANSRCIFMAKDSEGVFRQIGSKDHPARIDTNTIDTTTTKDGRKGATVEISAANHTPAPVYGFDPENSLQPSSSSSASI